jgi:hypothetical protein
LASVQLTSSNQPEPVTVVAPLSFILPTPIRDVYKSRSKISGFAIFALLAMATSVFAKPVAMNCMAQGLSDGSGFALSYEGEATGVMIATGSFGRMKLPATSRVGETPDTSGAMQKATMFNASGPTDIKLPALADIEACVISKLKPEELTDRDMKEITAAGCIQSLPPGASMVNVKASFEILVDNAGVGGFYSIAYAAKSKLGDDIVRIASYPLQQCKLVP